MDKIKFSTIILLLFLTSCFDLRFSSSFPKDKEELECFPSHLIGSYKVLSASVDLRAKKNLAKRKGKNSVSEEQKFIDTLVIKSHSFRFPLMNNEITIDQETKVLKRYNDTCYVYSQKNEEGKKTSWTVIPFTFSKSKLTVYSSISVPKADSSKIINSIKQITSVECIYKENTQKKKRKKKKTIDYWLINPSNTDFESLFEIGAFPKLIEFEKLK